MERDDDAPSFSPFGAPDHDDAIRAAESIDNSGSAVGERSTLATPLVSPRVLPSRDAATKGDRLAARRSVASQLRKRLRLMIPSQSRSTPPTDKATDLLAKTIPSSPRLPTTESARRSHLPDATRSSSRHATRRLECSKYPDILNERMDTRDAHDHDHHDDDDDDDETKDDDGCRDSAKCENGAFKMASGCCSSSTITTSNSTSSGNEEGAKRERVVGRATLRALSPRGRRSLSKAYPSRKERHERPSDDRSLRAKRERSRVSRYARDSLSSSSCEHRIRKRSRREHHHHHHHHPRNMACVMTSGGSSSSNCNGLGSSSGGGGISRFGRASMLSKLTAAATTMTTTTKSAATMTEAAATTTNVDSSCASSLDNAFAPIDRAIYDKVINDDFVNGMKAVRNTLLSIDQNISCSLKRARDKRACKYRILRFLKQAIRCLKLPLYASFTLYGLYTSTNHVIPYVRDYSMLVSSILYNVMHD